MRAIYRIICIPSRKCYVGSAQSVSRRWQVHQTTLRCNVHPNPKLQAAWNKYGAHQFRMEVIREVCPDENLFEAEQWYLDHTRCEFNATKIAGGGTTSRQTPQPSNPQENVRGPTAALGIAQKTGESTPFHDTAPQNEAGGIGTKTHRGKQAQDEPCSEVKASANSDTGRNREGASETQTGETHASMVQQNPCRVDWTKVEQAAPEAYRRGFEEGVATALKAREVAESYHLWVIDSPAFRFPLGYTVGAKIDPTPGTASQQRPFEGAA